ncbi:MAG: (Fe-S)-binding protein [Candidatus Thorarchaeota archaeon]|nr:(Fe-S)-binding protein [Candidatus Thorarchaeota archaeon]
MRFQMLEEFGLQDMPFICAQCSFCQVGHGACPTYKVMRRDSYSGKGKMIIARALLQGRISTDDALEGLRDAVFGCTLCGACEEVCQVDIPFVKLYEILRGEFLKRDLWPEQLKMMRNVLLKSKNIQGQPQMDRVEGWSYWHPDEDALLDKVGREAETAFFVGCASSYRGIAIQATIATTLIMDKIGEDYTLLGEEEWCCGAPLIMTGDFEKAREFALHNIEEYKKLGVKRIITNCPGCFKIWDHEYHEMLGIDHDFEILYGPVYFAKMIEEGRMKDHIKELDIKVTFHDGCDAGRNSGIYDEPRVVLENIPGLHFEELPHNRENSYCCGSGGVLRAQDEDFCLKINELKVRDIEQTDADWVISACPSCVDFINEGLPEAGSQKRSKDLAVILAEAMGFTWDGLDEVYG